MVGRCVVCVLHGAERQKCAPGVQMAMPRLWRGPDGKAFSVTCITSVSGCFFVSNHVQKCYREVGVVVPSLCYSCRITELGRLFCFCNYAVLGICDLLHRCSMNATPQQMSLAEKAVEKFIRNLGQSKTERKPVRPSVVEVSPCSRGGGHSRRGSQCLHWPLSFSQLSRAWVQCPRCSRGT